jgi:hypothetical protein
MFVIMHTAVYKINTPPETTDCMTILLIIRSHLKVLGLLLMINTSQYDVANLSLPCIKDRQYTTMLILHY